MLDKFNRNLKIWIPLAILIAMVPVFLGLFIIFFHHHTLNIINFKTVLIDPFMVFYQTAKLFSIFSACTYFGFYLVSNRFIKALNMKAREYLSFYKYIQLKEDCYLGVIGDDKKYIANNVEKHEITSYLRRITTIRPYTLIDKIFLVILIITGIFFTLYVFSLNYQLVYFYEGLLWIVMGIWIFYRLYQYLISFRLFAKKVDELIENQGVKIG